jgi:hypothetical protein
MSERAVQGNRHGGAARVARSPDLNALGRSSSPNKFKTGTSRKLIIYTLRLCRFGARRITVLAAVVWSRLRRPGMNKICAGNQKELLGIASPDPAKSAYEGELVVPMSPRGGNITQHGHSAI